MNPNNDEEKLNLDDDALNFDDAELNFDDLQIEQNSESPNLNISKKNINFFKNIPVTVTLEVSSATIPLGDLMNAAEGSVIELDKINGEPLDVKVNGTLLGHAEVVIINDKYGLRITQINDNSLDDLES